jgi:cytochrome c5
MLCAAAPAAHAAPSFEAAGSSGAAQLEHGNRLLDVLDCRGCHGPKLQGYRFVNRPAVPLVLWSSNLTHAAPAMSEAELRRLMTKGQHPSRSNLYVTPAQVYQHLSAPDLAAIIAVLRSLKPAGDPTPPPVVGPAAAQQMVAGNRFRPVAAIAQDWARLRPANAGRRHELGRYIATNACSVCHGGDLTGLEDLGPDLAVAAAYDRAQFETLMTTGVPIGGRTLHKLMQAAARENAAKMTVRERDALYAYLIARANLPGA